jgi:hypothetical protein
MTVAGLLYYALREVEKIYHIIIKVQGGWKEKDKGDAGKKIFGPG